MALWFHIFLSFRSSKWFCLLDVASYVPTNELNLSKYQADFVALSFYKMFGYPTGLGALLVRKSSGHVLQKRYFGGGTVLMTLSDEMFHKKRENITEAYVHIHLSSFCLKICEYLRRI